MVDQEEYKLIILVNFIRIHYPFLQLSPLIKMQVLYFIQLHTHDVMQYLIQLHTNFQISSTSATVQFKGLSFMFKTPKIKICGAQNKINPVIIKTLAIYQAKRKISTYNKVIFSTELYIFIKLIHLRKYLMR